ncbi:hypothetical protein E2562_021087, partial [Oryza meyeriana var. granulata]
HDFLPLKSSLVVEEYETNILQSSDGTFSCGFYNIYTNAFTFSIWYSNSVDKAIVWSANLGRPVHSRRSAITLRKDGNIVLTDYDGTVVWQTDVSFFAFAWFFVLRKEMRSSQVWAAEEGYRCLDSKNDLNIIITVILPDPHSSRLCHKLKGIGSESGGVLGVPQVVKISECNHGN